MLLIFELCKKVTWH